MAAGMKAEGKPCKQVISNQGTALGTIPKEAISSPYYDSSNTQYIVHSRKKTVRHLTSRRRPPVLSVTTEATVDLPLVGLA